MVSHQADHPGVESTLVAYCRAIDTRDWELLARCFRADCTARYDHREFEDRAALVLFMERVHRHLDATLHRLTNVQVTSVGPGSVHAVSYVDALLVRSGHPGGGVFHVAGTYADELEFVDDRWQIRERDFRAVWAAGNPEVTR